ncbi:unnamed protein product [Candida verbasci]|uniref:Uncharacterized protein n=1 Tax=Candida verbasci TaxID=1227364 RepID=A0A9W4TXG1_9ASCO|nr:unnamed protein product [Candida verbasci]
MLFNTFFLFVVSSLVYSQPVQKCALPKDIVSVGTHGWAMSPDEPCIPGKYCPYACPPGQLMNQWAESSKAYAYPDSMNGGLKCNSDGSVSKSFDRPYCKDGKKTVSVKNKSGKEVSFCQTVLPGNEAMLIPTGIQGNSEQVLAVPGTDYWASTAAHYYINKPGIGTKQGCVWGKSSEDIGNWAPYVAGMNMDKNGNTFVKIGYNPKYIDDFNGKVPNFGIRIVCDDKSKCNGLECEINPKDGYNKVRGPSKGVSLNAQYCIVTATNYSKAKIEVFEV